MKILEELKDVLLDVLKDIVKKDNISPTELDSAKDAISLLYMMGYDFETEKFWNKNSYRAMPDNDYSYRMNGYSGHNHKERMIVKLEDLADQAPNDHIKQMLMDVVYKMER